MLLSTPTTYTVRTVHLKHALPSHISSLLATREKDHSLAESLEYLTPDDRRKTLTLSGPTPAVDEVTQVAKWLDVPAPEVELSVELEENPNAPLRSQVTLAANQWGAVTLVGKAASYRLDLLPKVDGGGTVSFVVRLDQVRVRKSTGVMRRGETHTGITSFVRLTVGKPGELRAPNVAALETRMPYLTLRLVALPKR